MTDRKLLAQRAIVMAVVGKVLKKADEQIRAEMDLDMVNADRVNVVSPDDPTMKLGTVWKTETKPSAVVTSEPEFLKWHQDNYEDRVELVPELDSNRMSEIMAIVEARNPDLIRWKPKVKDWAREEILKATIKARQAVGPGGEIDDHAPPVEFVPPKNGTLTVKAAEDAGEIVRSLWESGRLNVATGEILELESGE